MRSFPTLDDYVAYYQGLGLIEDEADLVGNKNRLVSEIFYDWIKRLQHGCLFAAKLARKPSEARYQSFVFPRAIDNPSLAEDLNRLLDSAAQEEEAAQLIFSDIRTERQLVQLVNVLCRDERWYWTEPQAAAQAKDVRLIGLRWKLPGGKAVNHVLGFAPVDSMPLTRKAPFAALALRIREQKRTPIRKENGLVQVHLADMDSGLQSTEQHDRFWENTRKQKALLVEPTRAFAARARITFCICRENADDLDSPVDVEIEVAEKARKLG